MNPNFTVKELERQRKTLPELVFRREFLAEFLDAGGAILKRNEIQVGKCPPREDFESVVMGVDFALQAHERADQTAICICGVDREKRTWVIACYCWRDSWPGTLARTLNYIQAWARNSW